MVYIWCINVAMEVCKYGWVRLFRTLHVRWHLVPGVPHDGIAETVMTNGLIRVVHLHALRVPEEQGIWRGCDGEKGEDLSKCIQTFKRQKNGRSLRTLVSSSRPAQNNLLTPLNNLFNQVQAPGCRLQLRSFTFTYSDRTRVHSFIIFINVYSLFDVIGLRTRQGCGPVSSPRTTRPSSTPRIRS